MAYFNILNVDWAQKIIKQEEATLSRNCSAKLVVYSSFIDTIFTVNYGIMVSSGQVFKNRLGKTKTKEGMPTMSFPAQSKTSDV